MEKKPLFAVFPVAHPKSKTVYYSKSGIFYYGIRFSNGKNIPRSTNERMIRIQLENGTWDITKDFSIPS